jgi:ribonuclease PH
VIEAARAHGRAPHELRPTTIEPNFVKPATGSALIAQGETRVICTASVEDGVPRWMTGTGCGWATAEYGMLPASTGRRRERAEVDDAAQRAADEALDLDRAPVRAPARHVALAPPARRRSSRTSSSRPPARRSSRRARRA